MNNENIIDQSILDRSKLDTIFICYLIAIFLWAFLIIVIRPRVHDTCGYVILLIPFIALIVSMVSISDSSVTVEESTASAAGSEFVTLLIFPFYNILIDHEYDLEARDQLLRIIVIALIFNLLNCIDVWTPVEYLYLMQHLRSIFQVLFFALVIFAFYTYYSTTSNFTKHKSLLLGKK